MTLNLSIFLSFLGWAGYRIWGRPVNHTVWAAIEEFHGEIRRSSRQYTSCYGDRRRNQWFRKCQKDQTQLDFVMFYQMWYFIFIIFIVILDKHDDSTHIWFIAMTLLTYAAGVLWVPMPCSVLDYLVTEIFETLNKFNSIRRYALLPNDQN